MTNQETTTGVQELIDRLSQEGVAEGERQAEEIVTNAQREADRIVDVAREQANEILRQARDEADSYQAAGEEALRLAARDAVRAFGARVHDGLRQRLQELVQHQVQDPKLIRRMILDIAKQATRGVKAEAVEFLLPSNIISEDEARRRIEAGDADELTEFVQGLIGEDIRDGFTIQLGDQRQSGLVVRVADDRVEIDLTEQAIAELLAEHLLPRFRAIMRRS